MQINTVKSKYQALQMTANTATRKQTLVLPEGYEPTEDVVVIGRGKLSRNHLGNKRFRILTSRMLHTYANAPGKTEKSYIVSQALHTIRSWNAQRIGFVKYDSRTGLWHSPKDSIARITVAQAFRDSLSSHYKSSRENKLRTRQQERGYFESGNHCDTTPSSLKRGKIEKTNVSKLSAQHYLSHIKGTVESRSRSIQPEVAPASSFPVQGGISFRPGRRNGSSAELDGLPRWLLDLGHFPFQETGDPFEPVPIKDEASS